MKVAVVVVALVAATPIAAADNPLPFAGSTAEVYSGYARASQPGFQGPGAGQLTWSGETVGVAGGVRFGRTTQLAVLLNVQTSFFHADQVTGVDDVRLSCDGRLWASTVQLEYAPVPFVFGRVGAGALLHASDACRGRFDPNLTYEPSEGLAFETELRAGLRAHLGASPIWLELAAAIAWYTGPGSDTDAHYEGTTNVVLGIRGTFDRHR